MQRPYLRRTDRQRCVIHCHRGCGRPSTIWARGGGAQEGGVGGLNSHNSLNSHPPHRKALQQPCGQRQPAERSLHAQAIRRLSIALSRSARARFLHELHKAPACDMPSCEGLSCVMRPKTHQSSATVERSRPALPAAGAKANGELPVHSTCVESGRNLWLFFPAPCRKPAHR